MCSLQPVLPRTLKNKHQINKYSQELSLWAVDVKQSLSICNSQRKGNCRGTWKFGSKFVFFFRCNFVFICNKGVNKRVYQSLVDCTRCYRNTCTIGRWRDRKGVASRNVAESVTYMRVCHGVTQRLGAHPIRAHACCWVMHAVAECKLVKFNGRFPFTYF